MEKIDFSTNLKILAQKKLKYSRNLQFSAVADGNVVQVLHTALHSDRFAHLHHGRSLFGLQELDSGHISCKGSIFSIKNLLYRQFSSFFSALPTKFSNLTLTVQTDEIKQLVGVGCGGVETVDHHDRGLLLILGRKLRCGVAIGGELWRFLHETLRSGGWRRFPGLGGKSRRWRCGRNRLRYGAVGLRVIGGGHEGVARSGGAQEGWFWKERGKNGGKISEKIEI